MNDLRFAFRQLGRQPAFTAIAVLVLSLGTGVNATIFSLINAILVKPIRVPHPERLVGVFQHDRQNPDEFNFFSYPDFVDLRSGQAAAFSELFAVATASVGLTGEFTERAAASLVSANYFQGLGVAPALGRTFLPEEETSGTPVAVLTHDFWLRLGGDPAIVGRKLELARGAVTVIGVMPAGFTGAQMMSPQVFLPLAMANVLFSVPGQPASDILASRTVRQFMLMARLKPGLTPAQAAVPLANLNRRFEFSDPADPKPRTLVCAAPPRFGMSSRPTGEADGLAPAAGFAAGLAALVLIIACLNLANMLLAQGAARRKEIAIRLALGAARRRILAQLLTEGLLLAVMGAAAGLLISTWATSLVTAFVYSGVGAREYLPEFDASPDWRTLIVLLGLSGLATVAFALGPAWKLARLDVNDDLKRSAGDAGPGAIWRRFGARETLAAGQIALALALLVSAALFSRSAIRAADANPGFEFGANFYLTLDQNLGGIPEARMREFVTRALERLSVFPGVEAVSSAMGVPFGDGSWSRPVAPVGGLPGKARSRAVDSQAVMANYNVIGADYFRTLGIPLRQGREFERREVETTNAPPVAIISQNLADQLWPDGAAVGRRLEIPGFWRDGGPIKFTVVGVTSAVRWELFEKGIPANVYVPFGQDFQTRVRLHVRVAPGVDSKALMTAAARELRRLDPRIPVTEVRTLTEMHRRGPAVSIVRLGSFLFGGFGVLALLLSMLGVYGLKAYSVACRTREIGIRMALGANVRDVVAMILRESASLTGLGLGVGLLLALAVGRLAGRLLYDLPGVDPIAYCAAPAILLVTSLAASLGPARRAAAVDPTVALRHD